MAVVTAQTFRAHVRAGRYTCSGNVERARQTSQISLSELEEALSKAEIVEENPNAPGGPSYLLLGFSGTRPIHALCVLKQRPRELLIAGIMG